ncbi:SGNH/GDSL hydrolase family protein [Jeongeupia sp. USM3]|uniref:SGNH/GDSL hydrolase family protein n=1 Tax=Jeongeupia sp. USM3 TaxID=1906741 RepID=UPI00089E08C1|nr:SGNH/GDSL hydrolase family protein [Jeongeupia sp. USM3]AOX99596.1 hypothetical protein BJP62_03475 [Jeongeupia sp. USM3]
MQAFRTIQSRLAHPVTWLFYGDSITHGIVHTFGARSFSEHFNERVRFELDRQDDVVINTAFSGYTTRQLLLHFPARVARFRPDVVLLMAGLNDCNHDPADGQLVPLDEFRANLLAMIAAVRDWGGDVVLQTSTPVLAGLIPARSLHLPAYNDCVRTLAAETGAPLVDHARVWERQDNGWLYADVYHPNAHGHLLLARTLFGALGLGQPAAASERFFVPG